MDKKSILIGALGASLLFVTIGAGTSQRTSEAGTYQGFCRERSTYMLNTKTGELYVRSDGWKRKINTNWGV